MTQSKVTKDHKTPLGEFYITEIRKSGTFQTFMQLSYPNLSHARAAHDAGAISDEQRLQVLKLRLAASELALRAAQSAALHAGAKGYQVRHAAQRRTREAMFVAIVTPAIKHLRKEIHALEQASKSPAETALEQAS